jgi:hypothetical protein
VKSPTVHQASAWVWTSVGSDDSPVSISPTAFTACVDTADLSGSAVAACVLSPR